jgi:hypothetical protein
MNDGDLRVQEEDSCLMRPRIIREVLLACGIVSSALHIGQVPHFDRHCCSHIGGLPAV